MTEEKAEAATCLQQLVSDADAVVEGLPHENAAKLVGDPG